MAKRTHDIVATNGEYKNAAGETKKRYIKCGSAFTDDQGRISLKLDSVPVSPDWSGWLSLYDVERQQPHQQDAHNKAKADGYAPQREQLPTDTEVDDIPL